MKNASVLIFLLVIIQAMSGMEIGYGEPDEPYSWSLGSSKGKERLTQSVYSSFSDYEDFEDGGSEEHKKNNTGERPLVLNSVKATLNSSSQRKRAISLSLPKKNSAIQRKGSKRRSLESLSSSSEFEKQRLSLFDLIAQHNKLEPYNETSTSDKILDELISWIEMLMLKDPENCVTMEDLIQKKYALLKFIALNIADSAERHNDLPNVEYAQQKISEVEEDEHLLDKYVNLRVGYEYLYRARIALKKGKKTKDIDDLNNKQKFFFNYAQVYCVKAYQCYQNAKNHEGSQEKNLQNMDVIKRYMQGLQEARRLLDSITLEIQKIAGYAHFQDLYQNAKELIIEAQAIKKDMKPFEEFIRLLEEKRSKINSPRRWTAWVTKISNYSKKFSSNSDQEKIKKKKEKIKKILKQGKIKKPEEQKLSKVLQAKTAESYCKAIIEYKIDKNKFQYIQKLEEIYHCYEEASKKLLEAFRLNPYLHILKLLNFSIKEMENNNKKIEKLNEKMVLDGEFFKKTEEQLEDFLKRAEEIGEQIEYTYKSIIV